MKILITGGEGFLGTHLYRELRDHHKVVLSDRGDADLSKPGAGSALIKWVEPDYVVHLAARYGRILCRDEPHRAVVDNAAATTELAAACAEYQIPVLYSSSSEVYGDHGESTITEESNLYTPTTIYGLSKRWGEEALELYAPPLCTVRLNMLYGPEQRAGYGCCALATFIDKTLKAEPYVVHRNTSRSWLYVEDACRALRMLIEGGHTGVFNLGNDTEKMSMEDVAKAVGGTYVLENPPEGQIPHKNYSVEKLRSTIDWVPSTPLNLGIGMTFAWAEKHGGFRDYGGEVIELRQPIPDDVA